jgi:anti-anti-sigma regulatory factor
VTMGMTVEQAEGAVPVTILSVHGDLDAASFEALIARGRELYASGTRALVVDLTDLRYMGSSGLVALHSLALLLGGQEPPDPEAGWAAFREVGSAGASGQVRIANPQPQVDRTLERTGMKQLFEVHADRESAVSSFA